MRKVTLITNAHVQAFSSVLLTKGQAETLLDQPQAGLLSPREGSSHHRSNVETAKGAEFTWGAAKPLTSKVCFCSQNFCVAYAKL